MGGGVSSLTPAQSAVIRSKALLFLDDILTKYQETAVTIEIIRAYELKNKMKSDIYVLCHLGGNERESVKTTTARNTTQPSWKNNDGTVVIQRATGQDVLVVEIYIKKSDGDVAVNDKLIGESQTIYSLMITIIELSIFLSLISYLRVCYDSTDPLE